MLLCYSETNGLRACAFNGHAYLSPFRQLRQLQPCQFISQPQSGQKRVLFPREVHSMVRIHHLKARSSTWHIIDPAWEVGVGHTRFSMFEKGIASRSLGTTFYMIAANMRDSRAFHAQTNKKILRTTHQMGMKWVIFCHSHKFLRFRMCKPENMPNQIHVTVVKDVPEDKQQKWLEMERRCTVPHTQYIVTQDHNANIQHNRMAGTNTGKNCSPKGLSSISPSTGRGKMPDYKLLMINQNRLQDNGLETVARWAWCIFYLLLYFVTLIQRIKHWPINNCIPLDCIRAIDAKGVSFIVMVVKKLEEN